mmetsp:Transcript_7384/g.12259  ORF Transcript_7384/g.12259 Transcript_7384/m.12259 type:complete len:394 (+) Transcript_7384:52-1233(+)
MGIDQIWFVKGQNISENFICSVCTFVFDQPVRLPTCGHFFCKGCIKNWFDRREVHTCPVCRAEVDEEVDIDRLARREDSFRAILEEEERYCSNKDRKCFWTGPVSQLATHLSQECCAAKYISKARQVKSLKAEKQEKDRKLNRLTEENGRLQAVVKQHEADLLKFASKERDALAQQSSMKGEVEYLRLKVKQQEEKISGQQKAAALISKQHEVLAQQEIALTDLISKQHAALAQQNRIKSDMEFLRAKVRKQREQASKLRGKESPRKKVKTTNTSIGKRKQGRNPRKKLAPEQSRVPKGGSSSSSVSGSSDTEEDDAETISVFVKAPQTGKTLVLKVGSLDTVESIKERLVDMLRIPIKKQRLVVGLKTLEDGHRLSDYSIQNETSIQLSLSL